VAGHEATVIPLGGEREHLGSASSWRRHRSD
jgi:hypothetical protein